MKFLFASDSFKGTLSSERITALLEESAGRIFPGCETAGVPVADGGEGTIDAVISALNGTYRRLMVLFTGNSRETAPLSRWLRPQAFPWFRQKNAIPLTHLPTAQGN